MDIRCSFLGADHETVNYCVYWTRKAYIADVINGGGLGLLSVDFLTVIETAIRV